MSQTFLGPEEPIPATFDFAGQFESTGFLLYKPLGGYGAPQLLAGWLRLVSAFTGAMNELESIPGAWADQSIAQHYLSTTVYDFWRWSRGPNRRPVFLAVPYADAGDPVPPPWAPGPAARPAAVYIYAAATPVPALYQDGRAQGIW